GQKGTLSVHAVNSRRRVAELKGALEQVWALAMSPDGKTVAAVSAAARGNGQQEVRAWDVTTRKSRWSVTTDDKAGIHLAFSPDGVTLATGSRDTTVLLWDLTGQLGQEKPKVPPGEKELSSLWAYLDAREAKVAFAAMAQLQLTPADAVTLFARHLSPVTTP